MDTQINREVLEGIVFELTGWSLNTFDIEFNQADFRDKKTILRK